MPNSHLRETAVEADEEDFGGPGARSDDDDARSIRVIVTHELGHVEEEDHD